MIHLIRKFDKVNVIVLRFRFSLFTSGWQMVYAFLVHSLIPGQSTLIYQQVFNQGVTTSENNDDEIKTHRKNRLTDCAAQVCDKYITPLCDRLGIDFLVNQTYF